MSAREPTRVRAASAEDMAAVQRLYAQEVLHGTATFELEPPTEGEMERRWRSVLAVNLPYLVAAVGSAVVGFAYAVPYRPRGAYRFTVEESVYVAPEAQRRGVGRALLIALIEDCAARGRRQMVGVIADPGRNGSLAFHAALGFRTVGRLEGVGVKHGRTLDTLIVQRALREEDATCSAAGTER